jgi:phosphotransferase system HPr (HPr) family protein
MLEKRIRVVNRLGLHARAAAQLVKVANQFKSRITLSRPDAAVFSNAKSILSVLALAAARGSELHLSVEGADEAEAASAIESLFDLGFGEV